MEIKRVTPIEPELSRCISVNSTNKLFTIGESGNLLTHNSVSQQNIIFSCILRPKDWVLIGIDLKRVELTRFRKYGVKVAADLGPALDFLRFAQAVMMKRYERLEEAGLNNFRDLPVPGQALMVMIDEAGELLSTTGAKALSEHTLIPTPNGLIPLKDIAEGDLVFDNYRNKTTVTTKYEPTDQTRYKMKISSDKDNSSEEFIAGAEHLWVVHLKHPNGDIEGPKTMSTEALVELKNQELKKDIDERLLLKIKKG